MTSDLLRHTAERRLQQVIVLPGDIRGLLSGAVGGDESAAYVLRALRSCPRPRGCAICRRPAETQTDSVVMGLPMADDSTSAAVFLVCRACGPNREIVEAKTDRAWRQIPEYSRSVIVGAGSRA